MTTLELFEEIKEKFPMCFFTHKGKCIKVHDESTIDGFAVCDFTKFKFPYKLGIHHRLADYLEEKEYEADINKNNELIIKSSF